jgi:hypothetical protein
MDTQTRRGRRQLPNTKRLHESVEVSLTRHERDQLAELAQARNVSMSSLGRAAIGALLASAAETVRP